MLDLIAYRTHEVSRPARAAVLVFQPDQLGVQLGERHAQLPDQPEAVGDRPPLARQQTTRHGACPPTQGEWPVGSGALPSMPLPHSRAYADRCISSICSESSKSFAS